MKNIIKKIYTVLILIKNLITRKKYYKLTFKAEYDPPIKRWYYDFKHWGFNHSHLEMVAGADNLCEKYSKGQNHFTIEIVASKNKLDEQKMINYDLYVGENFNNKKFKDKILWGRNYTNIKTTIKNLKEQTEIITMWICPVTLFVLGRYPNYIYIKSN